MTDQEIRIAIAEVCGWRAESCGWWSHPNDPVGRITEGLPDYPNDLNAIADAERDIIDQLPTEDGKSLWLDHLMLSAGFDGMNAAEARFSAHYNAARATARERCEAFLKTFNLWTETPEKALK